MIVTVKYVENSQKNWGNIKNQKKKKKKNIKVFKKKTCRKFTKVYYLQLYTLLYLLK